MGKEISVMEQVELVSEPRSWVLQPATMADLDDAVALFNLCFLEETGKEAVSLEDIKSEWESPTFRLEHDTRIVRAPDGQLIGYVEVWDSAPHIRIYGWGRVHPDYRGQGIGTILMVWAEGRAREALAKAPEGSRVSLFQNALSTNEPAQALFKAQGFQEARYFFRMITELEETPPEPVWPEGLELRTFEDHQLEDVMLATRDAFRDHWGFVERPVEESLKQWRHWIETDPEYDPRLWYLAMDGEEIAAICLCRNRMTEDPNLGWVNTLGVRRAWRRRGLGLALLHQCFGDLYRRGRKRVGLDVDAASLTGATRLYEKAGMYVERQSVSYEKELRAGEDLSTQTLEG